MVSDALVDSGAVVVMLQSTCPTLSEAKIKIYSELLWQVCQKYGINTRRRMAAFVAQLVHESGEFRHVQEIWGPTKAQQNYGIGAKARELGNLTPADGYTFRGRGWIQLTGRGNYQRYGELLGLDLVNNPSLATIPDVAFEIAALYWTDKDLNTLADKGLFKAITKGINGGYNGLVSRLKYFARADGALKRWNNVETV